MNGIPSGRQARLSLGLFYFLVVGLACSESPTESPPPDSGTLRIALDEQVDGAPLPFGALVNENAAGNTYAVDRLRYFLCNVRAERADGSFVEVDAYHYRDAADATTAAFEVTLPGGAYDRISVLLGLDPELNVVGALDDVPEVEAMRWPAALGDGYHYVWLEGRYRDAAGDPVPFDVRTGRVDDGAQVTDHAVRVTLPASAVTIGEGTTTLPAVVNVNAWFDDPVYDLTEHPDMIDDLDAQAALRDNASNLFEPVLETLELVTFLFPGAQPLEMPEPDDNPTSRQGIALGRMLFYDPILSGDSTLACAGCHRQAQAFGDPRRFSVGIDGTQGTRQAPTIINASWIRRLFWDGRSPSLEDQAIHPVENPIEMHADWDEVVARIQAHPSYPALFARVFGTSAITRDLVVKAIAQFERSLISRNSRYDRWNVLQDTFTAQEERGFALFHTETAECFHCHHPTELFTGNLFFNIGLDSTVVDSGRGAITGNPQELAQFRAPTLRNVGVSAPYMHDGRFSTLEEVMAHYRNGVHTDLGNVDALLVGGLPQLTDQDIEDLIAFLHTLTDHEFLANPDHSNPFE